MSIFNAAFCRCEISNAAKPRRRSDGCTVHQSLRPHSIRLRHHSNYLAIVADSRGAIVEDATLQTLPQLDEVANVESLPTAMAWIDRNFDNLKLSAGADRTAPSDHPDLTAIQEALPLKENLHEASRRLSEKNTLRNTMRRSENA